MLKYKEKTGKGNGAMLLLSSGLSIPKQLYDVSDIAGSHVLITETRFVNGWGNVNNEKTVPGHNVKSLGKSLFHWLDANHMSAKKFRPEDWRQVTYPSTRVAGFCSFRLKRVIFSVQFKPLDLKTDRPNWLWKPKETSLLTWSDISEFQKLLLPKRGQVQNHSCEN